MAEEDKRKLIEGEQATVVDGDAAPLTEEGEKKLSTDEKLVAWVVDRTRRWKEHRNANYSQQWDQYERQWRAIYSTEEKTRKTERSVIISPAISEAVENAAAEIEEALFGRGDFFDVSPEAGDDPVMAAALSKNEVTFREDLARNGFTGACSETVINGAVYGTGIGEIVQTSKKHVDMVLGVGTDGKPVVKTIEKEYDCPILVSVNPRNFIIDPAARDIESALGCAVEEDVSAHIIRAGISGGDYKDVPIEAAAGDPDTKPDPQIETPWMFDVVPVLRYYGKVPKELLFPKEKTEDLFPLEEKADPSLEPVDTEMVEARIIIANESHLLKAVENPDMKGDRPLVSYQWDIVPGRFWGRGVCEKGATPAKLLDAELRSRMDALAFTAAPMMAIDATRLPRGFKFEVYPGRSILLSGDPAQILRPFKFGELDQNSGPQVQLLDQMVQRATGSIDGTSLARQGVGGDARAGAVSMALAPIVKRNKRTLMRYVDSFLAPALSKLLWRSMQYDQERYIPLNMTFNVSSTMGIMQREYETMNMVQMLNAMQPGTTEHLMILIGLVSNSGMQNRDQVLQVLQQKAQVLQQREAAPPVDPNAVPADPIALELQRQDALLELAAKQQKIAESQARTRLLDAQTRSEYMEPALESQNIALKGIYKTPEDRINEEFDRRIEAAKLSLKGAEIESKERIADKQIIAARANEPQPEIKLPLVPKPAPITVQAEGPVVMPVQPTLPGM